MLVHFRLLLASTSVEDAGAVSFADDDDNDDKDDDDNGEDNRRSVMATKGRICLGISP